jgi:outer membrane protein assembly factor BamB
MSRRPARRTTEIFTQLLLGLCAAGPLAAADAPSWPRFHGPKGDNLSTDTGLLKEWPKDGPKLLWTASGMGEGYATVSIADGIIYTDGNINGQTTIIAMDMDGKVLWKVPNGKAFADKNSYPGTRGTPTIEGDRLYLESPLGEIGCFNAKTGKEIWRADILKEFGGKNIQWALSESPVIDGDRVICTPGGPKTALAALDKMTGKVVWKSPSAVDAAGYATPAVVEYQGLRMVLTMMSKSLVGVNAQDGKLLFRHPHETPYDMNVQTPIFRDGQVFIATVSGAEAIKLSVDGQTVKAKQVWESKALDNHHGGVILLDGYLYGSCSTGWVCLEWKTGKQMYKERGVRKGSLTYADGMLYTLGENSTMGLVKAEPEAHKVVSQFKLPKGGEGASWAHPVVCGGRLYIRHGDFLYVYDVKAK